MKERRAQNETRKVRTLQPGDMVYVRNDGRKKMDRTANGPYAVVRVDYPNVVIRKGRDLDTIHLDRVLE